MKISSVSFLIVAGLSIALPAYAAGEGSPVIVVGQTPAIDCSNAAMAVSRTGNALPEFLNSTAMASCNDALASKLMVKDRVATLVNRGTLEAAALNTDAALADYDAALALRPQIADIHLDRGAALMRADRYDQARAEFDQALAMGTKSAHVAYLDRGMAEEKSGDVSAAYRDYKQALMVNPDYQEAKAELSRFQVEERVAADR